MSHFNYLLARNSCADNVVQVFFYTKSVWKFKYSMIDMDAFLISFYKCLSISDVLSNRQVYSKRTIFVKCIVISHYFHMWLDSHSFFFNQVISKVCTYVVHHHCFVAHCFLFIITYFVRYLTSIIIDNFYYFANSCT